MGMVVVVVMVMMDVENLCEGDAGQVVQGEAWSQRRAWGDNNIHCDHHQDHIVVDIHS